MTVNLSFSTTKKLCTDLKEHVETGKISAFINKVLTKELNKIIAKKIAKDREIRKMLIAGYKRRTKNKNVNKMFQEYGQMS